MPMRPLHIYRFLTFRCRCGPLSSITPAARLPSQTRAGDHGSPTHLVLLPCHAVFVGDPVYGIQRERLVGRDPENRTFHVCLVCLSYMSIPPDCQFHLQPIPPGCIPPLPFSPSPCTVSAPLRNHACNVRRHLPDLTCDPATPCRTRCRPGFQLDFGALSGADAAVNLKMCPLVYRMRDTHIHMLFSSSAGQAGCWASSGPRPCAGCSEGLHLYFPIERRSMHTYPLNTAMLVLARAQRVDIFSVSHRLTRLVV